MAETMIMVPLRYPLGPQATGTVRRAIDIAGEHAEPHLYFIHVNLLHQNEHVKRSAFEQAVEGAFGPLDNTSYHVRNAFLLEEAILQEAIQQDAAYVVIGKDTRSRWRRILTRRLGMDIHLEAFLRKHLGTELVVV